MTHERLQANADRLVRSCRPLSESGRGLLERYAAEVDLSRSPKRELELLWAACRLVEEISFDGLSVRALDEAGAQPQASKAGCRYRRVAAGRFRRLLQASGELPAPGELASEARLRRWIATAPPAARATLGRWSEYRSGVLGAYERSHEIRHLSRLERVIETHGPASDASIIQRWLRESVRPIVNCRCAPVTRAIDPEQCSCCGASVATHGTRPSPGPAKQRRLERLAVRYLVFRRGSTPTRQFA